MKLTADTQNCPVLRHLTSKPDWARVRARRMEIAKAEAKQIDGIESQDIFKATVESKLHRAGAAEACAAKGDKWFTNFQRCGVENFVRVCECCERAEERTYQCSLKWCPRCNWRVSMKRKELLKKITNGMMKVKHVVLTQKNFEHLTKEKIQSSRKALLDLRRQKIFGTVTGGCASLEFTNEENGWHMHWHLLIQSSFIPGSELALAWGKLVGQEFAIVKVMDVSEKSYLQEICKYVVDGSEIAKWEPWKILEFVLALKGTRSFTTFGIFKEVAKFARAVLATEKPPAETCECGSDSFVFAADEASAIRMIEAFHGKR